MGEKLVIGPINKGLRTDREPFFIDNDSFPQLINAYQWRGRVKRKRGTSFLGRLTRVFDGQSVGNSGTSPWTFNLFTSQVPSFTPNSTASIVPGTVQIFFSPNTSTGIISGYTNSVICTVTSIAHGLVSGDIITISGVLVVTGTGPNQINGGPYVITFVDGDHFLIVRNSVSWGKYASGGTWAEITGSSVIFQDQGNGTLTSVTPGNSGTIDYTSGNVVLTDTAGSGVAVDATFSYYPNLPVMGLETFNSIENDFPGTIAFDTTYSYNIATASPYPIYDVSFYKNPSADPALLPGYVPKTTETPLNWNGTDYQQFYSVNYQAALWVTNGVTVPFVPTNVGMQYNTITTVNNITTGPPAFADLTFANPHGLVVGDFLFINEVVATTGINFQTGYVTAVPSNVKVTVEFPFATINTNGTGGIAQYLTNNFDTTKDCIRWYDGDPTTANLGWVNFAPPLSQFVYPVGEAPSKQYYLAGAKIIFQYKDRLLFIGPVIQTSAPGSQIYLEDTIIYSQNGTPYYTSSFTNTPSATIDTPANSGTVFHSILVPTNQTSTAPAWFEDQPGFGGFKSAGLGQAINTVSTNKDALILGFEALQARFVYTGNDIDPFSFFTINNELGSSSTFSTINIDEGVFTRGSRGFIITNQVSAVRFDLEIPDQVFESTLTNNGDERITSQRDFINEWIYFSYVSDGEDNDPGNVEFPNQTLQYNYRDRSWGIFNETFTHYGQFRRQTGFTWATVGTIYPTWSQWNDPWDAGQSSLLQPEVIAGTQQGFVVTRGAGTGESSTLFIQGISGNTITSPNHCLNQGDVVIITGCIGTVGYSLNGQSFEIEVLDSNTFNVLGSVSGAYIGGGVITRIYNPFIQSKQFPASWGMGRKTRIGPQQYLFTTTPLGQITLQIFLSQDANTVYNSGPIAPALNSFNDSLIYSQILYTCPESTNLGLTPFNINLQTITDPQSGTSAQSKIWHRMNTSLIGDTVQIGFTMSPDQLTSLLPTGAAFAITGATQASPCVLECAGMFNPNSLIQINGVVGMTQLNGNTYYVISSDSSTVTIGVDSTAFTGYMSGGTATQFANFNQFQEIEFHSAVIDMSPAGLLS